VVTHQLQVERRTEKVRRPKTDVLPLAEPRNQPNVGFALRLYLTLPVTNCEGERSFSTLARIKNHLRASMGEARLSALSPMCIESELMRFVDFDDVINDFAAEKCRRRYF